MKESQARALEVFAYALTKIALKTQNPVSLACTGLP